MTMELIYESSSGSKAERPVFLICVFRDEGALLEYFMEYYRALGVTHFVMIDNASDDNGPEILRSLADINLSLYETDHSYRDADFGMQWINEILSSRCAGQYCLVVDADELFAFDTRRFASLDELVDAMEAANANVLATNLIDMYPAELGVPYRPGTDFRAHSPYFDDWNATYYSQHHRIYERAFHKVGGMRLRVFDARVCIHNLPFFKYDFGPICLAPGRHYFQLNGENLRSSGSIRLHAFEALLLHFKFLRPDFRQFVVDRIRSNQDWNDSAEYRAYLQLLDDPSPLGLYDANYSRRLTGIEDLDAFFTASEALAKAVG